MLTCIGYKKVKKIFKHHWTNQYSPIYKDLGKSQSPDKVVFIKDKNK